MLLIFSMRNSKGSSIIRKTLIFLVFTCHSLAANEEKQKAQKLPEQKWKQNIASQICKTIIYIICMCLLNGT